MCIDPKLEYCHKRGCYKYSECYAIFSKFREELHKINSLVPKNRPDRLCNMRVGENSPLRRDKNILW